MRLRKATINDLPTLQHWDDQPHVIASDPNDDWDWENMLTSDHNWQELLIAEVDQKPVGFIQVIDPAKEETHYWGEIGEGYRAIDIWIGEIENTGKGYGSRMMKMALNRCFSDPHVNAVLIDPLADNTRAIEFYERLGFRYVEKRQFGDDYCKVYTMIRNEWTKLMQADPDISRN